MADPVQAMCVAVLALIAVLFNASLHRIDEGHVGVYYRVSLSN